MSSTLVIPAHGGPVAASWFASAESSPIDVGWRRVGHFGFSRRGSEGLRVRALPWLSDGRNAFAAGA